MHNERLKRIAKFLGTQGLYKEANNLTKVAMADPFPGETGEMAARHEAYRAEGEKAIEEDLKAKVNSAIEKGITADEVDAICALGSENVKQIIKEKKPALGGEFDLPDPDEINDYIIGG
jgi:predicted GTPase